MNRCVEEEQDTDPGRWARYNEMMDKREGIDFENPSNCKRCGKPWGNHVTEITLKKNPKCCPFVK